MESVETGKMKEVREAAAEIYLQENHIGKTMKKLTELGYRQESGSKYYDSNMVSDLVMQSGNQKAIKQLEVNRKKVSKFAW